MSGSIYSYIHSKTKENEPGEMSVSTNMNDIPNLKFIHLNYNTGNPDCVVWPVAKAPH